MMVGMNRVAEGQATTPVHQGPFGPCFVKTTRGYGLVQSENGLHASAASSMETASIHSEQTLAWTLEELVSVLCNQTITDVA